MQLSFEEPSQKKLKPIPANAPRIVEKKGRFTFRKGVRIRDYRVLDIGFIPSPASTQFQCRDRFDDMELPGGKSQAMHRQISEIHVDDTGPSLLPFVPLPFLLEPKSTSPALPFPQSGNGNVPEQLSQGHHNQEDASDESEEEICGSSSNEEVSPERETCGIADKQVDAGFEKWLVSSRHPSLSDE